MHFYKLWRRNVGIDENEGHVVVAEDEGHARKLCNFEARDEGMIWENPALAECVRLDLEHPGIILTSFIGGGI